MFLLDDILLFPARGIQFVARAVHKAAEQESTDEAAAIRAELSELYMMLETGRITEEEFDAREKPLLDRFDAIEAGAGTAGAEGGSESG
jgi:hypothetical protein